MSIVRTDPYSKLMAADRTTTLVRWSDGLTEGLLYAAVIFTPWAFGATQPWAVRVMTGVGIAMGCLFLVKAIVRRMAGGPRRRSQAASARSRAARCIIVAMAILTVLVLAYCLVSALNARGRILRPAYRLEYKPCISWLPHSYDQDGTWSMFWMALGLAGIFWSARDWLGGRTRIEEHAFAREPLEPETAGSSPEAVIGRYRVPERWRRLLLVICFNASLVAVEGIVQRLSGTNRLLWLVVPRYNHSAEAQFGPYAYRSNACQLLNLAWPVCAGLAWVLRRGSDRIRRAGLRGADRTHGWLAAGAVVMAAAPFISLSRGGALVAAAQLVLTSVLLILANRRRDWREPLGVLLLVLVAAQLAVTFGYRRLIDRFETAFTDNLSGRLDTYVNAREMAADHPWFGTGPGSFEGVYQYYRGAPSETWEAYLHNDWLELRATFGRIGFGLILALLACVPAYGWIRGKGLAHWLLPATMCLGLAGCLLHARFDFPFRIYSIAFLFLLWCAFLTAHRPAEYGETRRSGAEI